MFFSFDGVDGAGKTTQQNLFCQWLVGRGQRVVECRDPGTTRVGEAIRDLLLQHKGVQIDRRCEMLLFMAARAQLVEEVIRPALDRGDVVVSDRYLLANVVYQGHAGGIDVDLIWRVGEVATQGLLPDLTFVFDLPPDAAAKRMQRQRDRMESQGDDFHAKLRAGYLHEAAQHSERMVVIHADRTIDEIQNELRSLAEPFLLRQA
jgi:dTMP kinase